MIKIGLTGGIATGKTTVSELMKKEGAIIIDTDLITHFIYKYPSEASLKILEVFGSEYLDTENNIINRKKLGQRVFANKQDLELLNRLVHPFIHNETDKLLDFYKNLEEKYNKNFLVVYVAPLLFESKRENFVDYILVISCSEENQVKRLMERNKCTKDEALKKINSQMPTKLKEEKAHFIIDANKPIDNVEKQVKDLLNNWAWDSYIN